MKEEKEKKVPSPMAILSGKSSAPKKSSEKSKAPEKKKRRFKRTIVDHHEDGSQTANREPDEPGGQSASFSRPDLKSMLAAIQEHEEAPQPEAEGQQPSGPAMVA
jgi:hypothetical protein